MTIEPVTLSGHHVRLEPTSPDHLEGLVAAAAFPELWQYMGFTLLSEEKARRWIDVVSRMPETGTGLGFTIFSTSTNRPVGGSGYWNIQKRHRKLEIGGSWVTPAFQRSAVNTETKYLLLRHAFEELGCRRVEFLTDVRNERTQIALERIGAKQEGLLRNHMLLPDGDNRDSYCYSVIESEWPECRTRLERLLNER